MPTPTTSRIAHFAKLMLRAKTFATLCLGLVALGLAAWIMQDGADSSDDGLSDDDFAVDVKPLGAMGVSDSAAAPANGDSAPLILPGLDMKALSSERAEEGQPLFLGTLAATTPTTPTSSRVKQIETAGFELAPPVTTGKKPATSVGGRVTANQAVWLSGTIEFDGGARGTQPQ